MTNPASELNDGVLRVDFDRRVMLQFRGSVVTSDAGLLVHRELDDALGLTDMAGEVLADERTGRNGRHALAGLFRQESVPPYRLQPMIREEQGRRRRGSAEWHRLPQACPS